MMRVGRLAGAVLAAGVAATSMALRTAGATMQGDVAMVVAAADRDAETQRLESFGVNVAHGSPVLDRPWDPPYSRRSFVVPQAWLLKRPESAVSADALAADLPILRTVMERAYGGWESARKRGWEWDKWFADWNAMLRSHGTEALALADAFAPMKQFMAFQLDNHTTIPLSGPRFGSGSQSALIGGMARAACTEVRMSDGRQVALDPKDPSQRPRRATRWMPSSRTLAPITYLTLPGNRGRPSLILCGTDWISMNVAWPTDLESSSPADDAVRAQVIGALSGDPRDEPDFKVLEPTVAYLRLPTFDERNGQLIEQRLSSWPKPTGAERVLIVDLRDNDGGSATTAPLERWVDTKRLPAQLGGRHEGASCIYHALRWGYMMLSTSSLKPPGSASLTRRLQTGLDDLFQPSPVDCPSEFKDTKPTWDYRQHVMRRPGSVNGHIRILALVNNGCGSDCEYMVMMLASLPETVIAGSNTFGVGQFIQPGYSALPHTRLPFRVALGMSDTYGDGRSFDGYGLDVDILLTTPDEQRPQYIVALAKYLGGQ